MLMQMYVRTRTKLKTFSCCHLFQWRNPDVLTAEQRLLLFICIGCVTQMVQPHAVRWKDCKCVCFWEIVGKRKQRKRDSLNPSLSLQIVQKHCRVAEWMGWLNQFSDMLSSFTNLPILIWRTQILSLMSLFKLHQLLCPNVYSLKWT